MKVQFVKSEEITKDIRTFWFKPDKPFRYIAGQFIELYLPHKNPDDRGQKRWFTLSSPPNLGFVSITTKITLNRSSFKSTLAVLKKGDIVEMSQPMGDFILPKDKTIRIIFVAGGIGCTPYASILSDLQNKGENRIIKLFYAANSHSEIAFKDIFKKLGQGFNRFVKKPLTAAKVLEKVVSPQKTYFYISGPEPMVEQLQKDFLDKGIPKNRIYTDFFPGYKSF